MIIYAQVFYNNQYWKHRLVRQDGELMWVWSSPEDAGFSDTAFPNLPLLEKRGRPIHWTVFPYLEGDL